MDEIGESIDRYGSDFKTTRDDIAAVIREGFIDGVREGMKKGFIDGVKDYLKLRHLDAGEAKNFERIVRGAAESALKETTGSIIKETVKGECIAVAGPPFESYMKRACSKIIEEIKNSKEELDNRSAEALKGALALTVKKINDGFGDISTRVRSELPTDVIFGNAVDGVQDGLKELLGENIKTCEERIQGEIDSKITRPHII